MDLQFRTISEEEFADYARAVEAAFSEVPTDEDLERERRLAVLDRCFGAFDGAEIVGTTALLPIPMALPGNEIEVGYVTAVGVKPTHRRRGINAELMRRQVEDGHERGDLVHVLYASEGGIYGRYGYGVATFGLALDVESARAAFVRGYERSGSVRLVESEAAVADVLAVHEVVRPSRPGMVKLDAVSLAYSLPAPGPPPDAPRFFVVHQGVGGVDGYAIYRVRHDWSGGGPRSTLTVRDLQAVSPGAYADLWRFVFDVDLTEQVQAWNRPVDDALMHLVREPRRLRATLRDNLWLRLVDVPEALRARRYASAGRLVLEVRDPFCPWNDGRYALEASADGLGVAERVSAEPDIACSVNEVGAVYLGGSTFRALHRAGRVLEERPGGSRSRRRDVRVGSGALVPVRVLSAGQVSPRTTSRAPSAPSPTASVSERIRRNRRLTRWAPAPSSAMAESDSETPARSAATVRKASSRPPSNAA